MNTITNPILKGFNPDPSIIRVDDDYYIATSTFEWYPGVQIHYSKDLKNWQLVAHPLNRNSQLNMLGEKSSCGIWAPCLSYDKGTYYLVYTDVKDSGSPHNYLVTTQDILGDWSEPIYLDSRGFDPSLFHDDDGKKWYTVAYYDHLAWNYMINGNFNNMDSPNTKRIWGHYNEYDKGTPLFKGIYLQEYSEEKKRLIGEPKHIFGNEIGITEGPHQYKLNGYYYLLMAEGGTSYEHAVTLARSINIDGPYEVHPENPIIRSLDTDAYLQKTGHADIVETKDGEWYMVHLCSRPLDTPNRQGSILGRETSIQKMVWGDDHWLRLESGSRIAETEVLGPNVPEHTFESNPIRDDFDSERLNINFQWLRGAISDKIFSLTERPGFLRLKGREITVSNYQVALVARRQQAVKYEALTAMEFMPNEENQTAGMMVMYHNTLYHFLYMGYDKHMGPYISIMTNEMREINLFVCHAIPVKSGKRIYFKAIVDHKDLQFYYGFDEDHLETIGPVLDMNILTDERSGCFTGAFVGMVCNDPATHMNHADFDFFDYSETED